MNFYMYIAPGQGLTSPWGWNFDVNRNILSHRSFVGSLKILFEVWFYTFFHDFIHVYSPGTGADSPPPSPRGQSFDFNSNVLSLHSIVASLKKMSLKYDFKLFFHDLIHVYSPGVGDIKPPGDKFWCHQKGLITTHLLHVSKESLSSIFFFYAFFHDLIHIYIYSPGVGDIQPPGVIEERK